MEPLDGTTMIFPRSWFFFHQEISRRRVCFSRNSHNAKYCIYRVFVNLEFYFY